MISWSLPQTALETSGIIADSWQLFEGERYKTQCRLIDPFRLLRFCSVRVSRLAHEWTDGGPMNNVAPAAGCIIIGLLGSESSPNINWADRSLNARSTLLLTSTTASGKKKNSVAAFSLHWHWLKSQHKIPIKNPRSLSWASRPNPLNTCYWLTDLLVTASSMVWSLRLPWKPVPSMTPSVPIPSSITQWNKLTLNE